MPMNRSGRSVAAASRVIEIDEVLVPTMVSGFSDGHKAVKILRLVSSCSVAASMTRSQSPRSSSVLAGAMRLIAAWRCSSLMRWRLTCRARLPLMVAIPSPIWPAPTTPILRMVGAILAACSPRICGALGRSLTSTIPIHLSQILRRSWPLRHIRSVLNLIELGREFRQRLVEVRHQPVVGYLKDRRFLVFIDRDDHFGVLHAGEMLNGAGNTDGDVKVGRHHFSGLADLPVVRRIAGVDRC